MKMVRRTIGIRWICILVIVCLLIASYDCSPRRKGKRRRNRQRQQEATISIDDLQGLGKPDMLPNSVMRTGQNQGMGSRGHAGFGGLGVIPVNAPTVRQADNANAFPISARQTALRQRQRQNENRGGRRRKSRRQIRRQRARRRRLKEREERRISGRRRTKAERRRARGRGGMRNRIRSALANMQLS
ncbi:unnamed protein product [Owenia fusiformis]|uniref:Uncharacterized protein n=1 Tax=Owenia fusiformis TaxID=6347 RepID=A0A8J1UF52_OWEFU|nr:unnamed protein product [Owenia fusiformis]